MTLSGELTEREQLVFAHVVASYLNTAEPVGSHAVAKVLAAQQQRVSSATVRHIMAELEAAGLLAQPHTSAGRIPTPAGLRYYVDCLIETEPVSQNDVASITETYAATDSGMAAIVQETSRILARLSHHVGLVVAPVRRELIFEHMEFLRLSGRRILGIFVTREGTTQNRVIETPQEFSTDELARLNAYCSGQFRGLTLAQASQRARTEWQSAHDALDALRQTAMEFTTQMLEANDADIAIEGETSLLLHPEFAVATKAKRLLDALQEKAELVELFERSLQSDGVQVFIGAESCYDALHDCSVVMSPYRHHGRVLGTLGVIGPTRMAYGRVIPIVQCAASLVGQWLEQV